MENGGFWSPGGDPTGCAGPAYGHSGAGAGFKTNLWVSGDGGRVAVLLLNARRDMRTDEHPRRRTTRFAAPGENARTMRAVVAMTGKASHGDHGLDIRARGPRS